VVEGGRLGRAVLTAEVLAAAVVAVLNSYARPSQLFDHSDAERLVASLEESLEALRRSGVISDARSDQFNLFERKTDMINHGQLAAELLNDAKQVHGNPSHANTLALLGIGNALLQIAEQLGRLDHLRTMVGSLDEISQRP
jgi:hypothetical protein